MNTNLPRKSSASRRTKVLIGAVFLAAALGAGCSRETSKVVIRGSNTIGEELAPQLIAEFQKDHSGVTFDTEFKGTSYGLGALMVDRCDIAAASREITTNELALAGDRAIEFNDYVIGAYSVAVIVNGASPVADLTKDQVRDIFTGAVQNWKDVGGADAPIQLYIRDPISGTHIGFRELAMENKPYALHLKALTNYTDIVKAVAQDANGIGYTSIELSAGPGIKAVSIGGAAPTSAANQTSYPYSRVLRFYTNKAKESQATRDFIQFVQSDRGRKITGYAPTTSK